MSRYFPGKKYYKKLIISKTPDELINKLSVDSLNIMYAAAYLKIISNLWTKEGFPIDEYPEILGTLYSTGIFFNGNERKPNLHPRSNLFGKKVKMALVQLLGELK